MGALPLVLAAVVLTVCASTQGSQTSASGRVSALLQKLGFSDICVPSALDACAAVPQKSQWETSLKETRDLLRHVVETVNTVQNPPRHCKDLLDAGETGNGVRVIHPYPGQPDRRLKVYCDQTTDGGGWTVFQRRTNATVRENFERTRREYVMGFGNISVEFWLGLENLHALTTTEPQELRVDLADWEGGRRYAKYGFFHVEGREELYLLTVLRYSGDASDSLGVHNGGNFSTAEWDNDGFDVNCAKSMGGVLWLLGLVWAGSCVQVLRAQSFSDNDVDQMLNRTYDNMVNILAGKASYNMDVAILIGLQLWCFQSGWMTAKASLLEAYDAIDDLERVAQGECVPPKSWMTYASGRCLTEEEASKVLVKELVFSLYTMAAITMEAMTETRLQYYVQKDKKEFVLFLSDRFQAMFEQVLSDWEKPSAVIVSNLYRLRNLLKQRHVTGYVSSESLVRAAGRIAKGLYSLLQASPLTLSSVPRIVAFTQDRTSLFTAMYMRNLNRILSTAMERHDKVLYRAASRYWDARAMEYGVSWLFRINALEGTGAYKLDTLLAEILEKHVAGDIGAATKLTQRGLADTKKYHYKLGPGGAKGPLTKVPFVGVIPNVALQDVSILQVPTVVQEVDELAVEEVLQIVLGESYVEYMVSLKNIFR